MKPSQYPGVWNLKKVFLMSSMLAAVALLSSLILLYLCLNSWDKNSLLHTFGLQNLNYGQITTVIYLKVSVSDFLTLFSARTHDGFFWSSMPSPILLIASVFALSLSTLIACIWPVSQPDGISAIGLGYSNPKTLALFVWLYCLVWWLIQDGSKVLLYMYMEKNSLFGINDSSGNRRKKLKNTIKIDQNHIKGTAENQKNFFLAENDGSSQGQNPIFTNLTMKKINENNNNNNVNVSIDTEYDLENNDNYNDDVESKNDDKNDNYNTNSGKYLVAKNTKKSNYLL